VLDHGYCATFAADCVLPELAHESGEDSGSAVNAASGLGGREAEEREEEGPEPEEKEEEGQKEEHKQ
jgi:hypothetical protein